jgi:hypothetical protein
MTLWQFVVLAIGAAVTRDTQLKRLYTLISQSGERECSRRPLPLPSGTSWTLGRVLTTCLGTTTMQTKQ